MIDLKALWIACQGDQAKKVAVKKSWLREIHSELEELERYREAARRTHIDEKIGRGFDKLDDGVGRIFGKGGAFDDLFGKGRRK